MVLHVLELVLVIVSTGYHKGSESNYDISGVTTCQGHSQSHLKWGLHPVTLVSNALRMNLCVLFFGFDISPFYYVLWYLPFYYVLCLIFISCLSDG